MIPDFVVVGNVARDVTPDGWLPGGTAVYAAAVARGLGRHVGLVTAATEDVAVALPADVEVVRCPAAESTSFENIYTAAGRIQYLRAAGEPIPAGAVPEAWTAARVALIGPVYHEIAGSVAARFRGLVGVCAQGYLRRAWPDGRVEPLPATHWNARPVLRHASALFLSEEDIGTDTGDALAAWTTMVPIVVVTHGREGARVHAAGAWHHIPSFPAREVDPTGAGDAFAAGFLIALDEGSDPWAAARFGAATASLVVEAAGPVTPTRAAADQRMTGVAPSPSPSPTRGGERAAGTKVLYQRSPHPLVTRGEEIEAPDDQVPPP